MNREIAVFVAQCSTVERPACNGEVAGASPVGRLLRGIGMSVGQVVMVPQLVARSLRLVRDLGRGWWLCSDGVQNTVMHEREFLAGGR